MSWKTPDLDTKKMDKHDLSVLLPTHTNVAEFKEQHPILYYRNKEQVDDYFLSLVELQPDVGEHHTMLDI